MQQFWTGTKRRARYYAISLFRVDDDSERVARGFALGSLINFYPTFGFGIVISGFLAGICRGNVLAGLVGGGLLTILWPLLFFLNMQVGDFFYRSPVVIDELEDVNESTIDALVMGKTFLWGATLNGLFFSLVAYGLVYYVHSRSRLRVLNWLRHLKMRRHKSRS